MKSTPLTVSLDRMVGFFDGAGSRVGLSCGLVYIAAVAICHKDTFARFRLPLTFACDTLQTFFSKRPPRTNATMATIDISLTSLLSSGAFSTAGLSNGCNPTRRSSKHAPLVVTAPPKQSNCIPHDPFSNRQGEQVLHSVRGWVVANATRHSYMSLVSWWNCRSLQNLL